MIKRYFSLTLGIIFTGIAGGFHTPLHEAAAMGDLIAVRRILAAPGLVAVRAENHARQIPLHVAAVNNRVNIIRELLNKDNGLINMYESQHRTPLYLAAQNDAIDAVRELLREPTIDVNRQSLEGLTAAQVAERNGYPEIAQLIRAHGTAGASETVASRQNLRELQLDPGIPLAALHEEQPFLWGGFHIPHNLSTTAQHPPSAAERAEAAAQYMRAINPPRLPSEEEQIRRLVTGHQNPATLRQHAQVHRPQGAQSDAEWTAELIQTLRWAQEHDPSRMEPMSPFWQQNPAPLQQNAQVPTPQEAPEAVFTPAGDRIVTARDDGTARIWTTTGEPLQHLEPGAFAGLQNLGQLQLNRRQLQDLQPRDPGQEIPEGAMSHTAKLLATVSKSGQVKTAAELTKEDTEERCPICLTTISEIDPAMHARTPCCNQFICADDLAILRALGKPCPLCRSTTGWDQRP